jgi:AcrR family transcriptional regulator
MPDNYHHGDLPSALRAATVELVAERGPSGFSLREVARRAGVSHAAPAHHFGDSRGLLTAVAVEGFTALADALTAAAAAVEAAGGNARSRLRACGEAYVATARSSPGHYAVMLDDSIKDSEDPDLQTEGMRAFAQLVASIEAVRDEENPDLDVDAASTLCWAAMHGLVDLHGVMSSIAEQHGVPAVDIVDRIHQMNDLMLDGLARR